MPLAPSAHVDTFTRDNLPPADLWPPLTFTLPELAYPQRLNCAVELLDRADPGRPCLLTPDGERWTYGELRDRANRIAHHLTDIGLVPGNRVLLRAPNNPWLVACWFGVLRMGGVAVTTMPLLRATELQTIHEIARINHSLVDDRFVEDLRGAGIGPYTTFDALRGLPAGAADVAVGTSADDVALLAFTSGTTGRPKATMHFHRDVLAIADTFSAHVLKPTSEDLFTGSPPLGFTFGLGGLVVFPMRVGAATLLLEKGTPDVMLPALAEHRPTVLFTAPTAYRAMVGLGGDFSSLRRCVSAGEPLPRSTWDAWHGATGIKIIDGIGSTELLHIFISAADEEIRPGATGKPIPGYEAAVLSDTGEPVPDGQIGRLAVRGPTGCRYLADDRQKAYVQHGWNLTGDTYLRDTDGYFWYQARSDDMIISAGFNIAGPEVEMALLRHPDVLECAVVGAPDPERTMAVRGYVVLKPGIDGTPDKAEEMRTFVRSEIAPYKAPRMIEFVDALPRTSTGKVQRYVLRERAAGSR
ncbi:MAG TPA: AMP-binding protein [Micromonosporaceae bacterium]|jgi:2-aminobenzoate-CoA ligase|nr:AMP-binding protein [Micromonosporaceae bacterium]